MPRRDHRNAAPGRNHYSFYMFSDVDLRSTRLSLIDRNEVTKKGTRYVMKRIISICAALTIATVAFSSAAESKGVGAKVSGGSKVNSGMRFSGNQGSYAGNRGGYRVSNNGRQYSRYSNYNNHNHHHNGHYYNDNYWGYAAAAGAVGLLAGSYYYGGYGRGYYDADVSYCMQRYRSYDPNSGTYLGYDGHRYAC